jgi:hypothetical protein
MRTGTLRQTIRVRPLLAILIAWVPGAIAGHAQTPVAIPAATPKLAFDVASVRQNKSGSKPESNFPLGPGDMYAQTGGVFSASDQTLITYIAFAYKLTISQAEIVRQHLPEWVMSDRFDIEARTEDRDPTKDQMRAMMQSLLADRFQLKVHDEARQLPVFGLVLAKAGQDGAAARSACGRCVMPDLGVRRVDTAAGERVWAFARGSARGVDGLSGAVANGDGRARSAGGGSDRVGWGI